MTDSGSVEQDQQREEWEHFAHMQREHGRCPYTGIPTPTCKASVCDCFEVTHD